MTVLMDSFGELERLAASAALRKTVIRAGVRVTPPGSAWKKFGIPLEELGAFWTRGVSLPGIDRRGLQFHSSWNLDPRAQIATLEAIGRELASWGADLRRRVTFLDIGGGFWPPWGEWIQPGAAFAGRLGELLEETIETGPAPFYKAAAGIGTFARDLGQAVEKEIFKTGRCRICLEPGRWVCHEAMHILLRVVDRKGPDLAITDGGTNAVGWERFESDYVPVLNLTRPALRENRCQVVGSLCTPHDFWGYSYWGEGIEPGDVLLVPDQGAYTYSLRQH
ncbi:MAG TPA: decarboxylase, partial [bacterium]|nr:decarboxylase [bacterium]